MNNWSGRLSGILRTLGWLHRADYLRYAFLKLKNYSKNKAFKKEHPHIALPPDYLMYESFQLDYQKYYLGGRQTAEWVWGEASPFLPSVNSDLQILDWGCGPGRVVRHLPDLVPPSTKIFATDYNQKSIEWNHSNLLGIEFGINQLSPPLNFPDQTFHFIYSISIFTHLSEAMHKAWWQEIMRILQPGGIFFFTTQGANFIEKLAPDEKKTYLDGRMVVRGQVKEGHRTFSAFHPPEFIHLLVGHHVVLRHQTPPIQKGKATPQDVWIVQKT